MSLVTLVGIVFLVHHDVQLAFPCEKGLDKYQYHVEVYVDVCMILLPDKEDMNIIYVYVIFDPVNMGSTGPFVHSEKRNGRNGKDESHESANRGAPFVPGGLQRELVQMIRCAQQGATN